MPRKVVTPTGPLSTKDEIMAALAEYPALDVLSRRFVNPNDPGSLPILLADESGDACVNSDHQRLVGPKTRVCSKCRRPVRVWHVYWANTGNEGRWSQIKTKGYIPVQVKDLKDREDVTGLVASKEDNGEMWVRRGDTGKEILMKIPLIAYNFVKAEAQTRRDASFKSKKKVNEELVEAAARAFGDQAGQEMHDGAITVDTMRTSRSTVGAEAGLD